jgi:hypothetical protein
MNGIQPVDQAYGGLFRMIKERLRSRMLIGWWRKTNQPSHYWRKVLSQ